MLRIRGMCWLFVRGESDRVVEGALGREVEGLWDWDWEIGWRGGNVC